ncbi:leucine--tRNA ligase [Buchnera aphidicola]|uniref:Leucine--tRNA ligase n=1 Tax=Buchnera aphidicola (Therioaphis trifolii) TaxID=1241884 RepID=A0A4D6YN23_9GAMM|nr:leucine--tRNA ligase [Buchnera aphidicola]QCI27278.1 leucine--tRNA ligase [Buchnera aphidicola (Therioaphis trifolii)]
MQKTYDPNTLEFIVQEYWEKNKTFKVFENKNKIKYYCLAMLPYPSGKLHMGHVRNYTISDVIARYQRMIGKNVLHPIGWDAFGLPAEEAAIKHNIIPSKWTNTNIKYMKQQLKKLGFSYDWDREITTCDSEYYKWEQWFFKKLYKLNLIYKKTSLINWCPKDKTVLANEQVINGTCWRCQSKIITKIIPQWFIKIKKYAEKLLKDLNLLNQWPKKVIKMQKNWIGKFKGFEIQFELTNTNKKIKTYTTRLDLLFGITYISISPLHDLAKKELNSNEVQNIIKNTYNVNQNYEYSKIQYLGKKISRYAIHPITKKKIPIWITNYINLEYDVNSKISFSGHNKYDWEFSKKYNIKNKFVILKDNNIIPNIDDYPIENTGILFNSYEFNGLNSTVAQKKIFNLLNKKNIIKKKNKYKLQDWGISRQRYWGTPIPVAYHKNNTILIPNKKLPILPPKIKNMSDFKNIKEIYKNWSKITINNISMIKETDTFDTFIESSWYYIRYTAPKYNGMINKKAANYWLPIDQYIGGIEHATMHLIYFRFFHKLLYELNLVNYPEPAKKLLCQGMVLSDAFYYIDNTGKKIWISKENIKIIKNKHGKIKNIISNNIYKIIHAGMIKMSKSKNNGIDPELMIKKYGADTIRLFIMFSAPVTSNIEWNESGVKGMYRFLQKIWTIVYNYIHNVTNLNNNKKKYQIEEIKYILNQTILKVSQDIENRQSFNTAISEIMKFINIFSQIIQNDDNFIKKTINIILKLLYPFTPHFSFILWKKMNNNTIIDYEKWPKYDKKYIIKNNINFIIQVNGKKKDILIIKNNTTQQTILNILYKKSKISSILKIQEIKKIIYIPNKLINLII